MLKQLRLITVMGKQHVINKGVKRYETFKKTSACLLLSLLVVTSMFSTTNSDKAYAEDHSYDGKSPYYNSCDQSAVTKEKKWIDSNSYVELKFSTMCKTAWAKVTVTRPQFIITKLMQGLLEKQMERHTLVEVLEEMVL